MNKPFLINDIKNNDSLSDIINNLKNDNYDESYIESFIYAYGPVIIFNDIKNMSIDDINSNISNIRLKNEFTICDTLFIFGSIAKISNNTKDTLITTKIKNILQYLFSFKKFKDDNSIKLITKTSNYIIKLLQSSGVNENVITNCAPIVPYSSTISKQYGTTTDIENSKDYLIKISNNNKIKDAINKQANESFNTNSLIELNNSINSMNDLLFLYGHYIFQNIILIDSVDDLNDLYYSINKSFSINNSDIYYYCAFYKFFFNDTKSKDIFDSIINGNIISIPLTSALEQISEINMFANESIIKNTKKYQEEMVKNNILNKVDKTPTFNIELLKSFINKNTHYVASSDLNSLYYKKLNIENLVYEIEDIPVSQYTIGKISYLCAPVIDKSSNTPKLIVLSTNGNIDVRDITLVDE